MYPINQVILGSDPILNGVDDIDLQIQKMEAYRKKLQQLKAQNSQSSKLIWDDIDSEILPLTEEQKARMFNNEEYIEVYSKIQSLVQNELLNLVKHKIENTPEGKELLEKQYRIIKKLKGSIIEETNREISLFKKFKDASKTNPNMTYEEFIKNNVL